MVLDLDHGEGDSVRSDRGADFGEVAEKVEGEAPDRLDLAVGRKMKIQALVQLFKRDRRINLV